MAEYKETNSPFVSRFSNTKAPLTAKIILLRKTSQENHVRRMKLAYKMKEMNDVSDISSSLSPSFSRKCVQNVVSPNVGVQSCTGNMQSRRTDSLQVLPVRANSSDACKKNPDSFKGNLDRKSTATKIVKKRLFCTENKTNISGGVICHSNSVNKNKSMTKSNDCLENKLQCEANAFPKDKNVPSPQNNKDENDSKDKKSSIPDLDNNNSGDKEKKKSLVGKKTPSKIPILKSRLKVQDNLKEYNPLSEENSIEVNEESQESMLADVENQFKELSLQETVEGEHEDICFEESYTLPQLMFYCCEDDTTRSLNNSFCKEEASRNEISLIDKWMNGVLDSADGGMNSCKSSSISKFKRSARTSSPGEKNPFNNLRGDKIAEYVDNDTGSRFASKYDCITDDIASDESSETYCSAVDIEITRETEDISKWNYANFEADSTITVPSDKDLEVSEHGDPIYKTLPEYPNTPYNLRYPRFQFKGYDNIYNSLEIESPVRSNQAKGLKNRRKSSSATPKRVNTSKKKKTKKQIVRKKYT